MAGLAGIDSLRDAVRSVESATREASLALERDLAAKDLAKKQRTALDDLEDKVMAQNALAAAASGSPQEAKAMLAKMRAKAMRAAADGADTTTLESVVRDMERLAKIAEQNHEREKKGGRDASAAVIPSIVALGKV